MLLAPLTVPSLYFSPTPPSLFNSLIFPLSLHTSIFFYPHGTLTRGTTPKWGRKDVRTRRQEGALCNDVSWAWHGPCTRAKSIFQPEWKKGYEPRNYWWLMAAGGQSHFFFFLEVWPLVGRSYPDGWPHTHMHTASLTRLCGPKKEKNMCKW